MENRSVSLDGSERGGVRPYIDAMDWNVARFTAIMPMRVGSEKCAASNGVGPLRCAL